MLEVAEAKRLETIEKKLGDIQKRLDLIDSPNWFPRMEKWGWKVRDDIRALEDAVIELADEKPLKNLSFRKENRKIAKDVNRYVPRNESRHGDPGDPPGDPWEGA